MTAKRQDRSDAARNRDEDMKPGRPPRPATEPAGDRTGRLGRFGAQCQDPDRSGDRRAPARRAEARLGSGRTRALQTEVLDLDVRQLDAARPDFSGGVAGH